MPDSCGTGGTGGVGGIFVGDGSALSGAPTFSGDTGGKGGAGGTDGAGPASGSAGSAGTDEVRPGTQSLSWTTAPPVGEDIGASFGLAARSSSGPDRAPVIGAANGCTATAGSTPGTATIDVTATALGICTVTAAQAGDTFYQKAATLSASVNMLDPGPVITRRSPALRATAPGTSPMCR